MRWSLSRKFVVELEQQVAQTREEADRYTALNAELLSEPPSAAPSSADDDIQKLIAELKGLAAKYDDSV